MKFYPLLILFLLVNFATLGIEDYLMEDGLMGSWYKDLNKAPWTPPSWIFSAAWTLVTVCFSIFMAHLVKVNSSRLVIGLFVSQFILSVLWIPMFFIWHEMSFALITIILLSLVVGYFMIAFRKEIGNYAFLMVPYFVWLLIATSLNVFAVLHN